MRSIDKCKHPMDTLNEHRSLNSLLGAYIIDNHSFTFEQILILIYVLKFIIKI